VNTAIAVITIIAAAGGAPAPSGAELLRKYDAIMGAESFDASAEMTSRRDDGTSRTYKMRILKSGRDKVRVWFTEPASVRGQEMLRQGENLWVYLPNLKKATRIASRESFQGGDFNNADVLRSHYETDYEAQVQPASSVPDAWELELKARTHEAAYDRIKLWLAKSDAIPIKGEYYTASGKLLRVAQFSDVQSFGALRRPARVVMKNMIATQRSSQLLLSSFNTKATPSSAKFVLDDLGK
jgi:outer membrane lipoprotein-sorting protein